MATSKKALTKTAVEKPKKQVVLAKEGQYFTAVYNKEKIRGVVSTNSGNSEYVLCNKTQGEDASCADDNMGFAKYVDAYELTQDALEEAGISDFWLCTDKRQKAIIDTDKNPEVAGYVAQVDKDDEDVIKFGCGSVEFTREEIQLFLKAIVAITPSRLDELRCVLNQIEDEVSLSSIKVEDVKKVLAM